MDYADEQLLFHFGTQLDPLEEDNVPRKKIAIEEQIVTDENGRRRFHGAFTGGFSAGFWNTVGSLEGWKPKSFRSSRTEKAEIKTYQQPKDFMDDEDLGEFGIAPQRVQAKDDFAKIGSNNRKRIVNCISRPTDAFAPILQDIIEPPKAKVALRLLMQMGWKPGQGIGPRQSRKEKALATKRNNRELYVIRKYGCDIEPNQNSTAISPAEAEDSSEDENDFEITFAPDDIEPHACSSKDNVFGLGYSGLGGSISSKITSHINLFGPLEVLDKYSKKLSIKGQAFGVGALEEEEEDIYAKDDMSQYDFCLSERRKCDKRKSAATQEQGILEGFTANSQTNKRKSVFVITLEANFQPKNWLQRKTRFSKVPGIEMVKLTQNNAFKKRGIARHDIGPDERGKILSGQISKSIGVKQIYIEEKNLKTKASEGTAPVYLTKLTHDSNIGTEGSISNERTNDFTQMINDVRAFKPFAHNNEKQERYEKFLAANLQNENDIKTFFETVQPIHLSEWDKEMERKEFVQAQNIYKPLNGLMSERFVSKTFLNDSALLDTKIEEHCEKKVIHVQRTKCIWKPCSLICKRFNIPEQFSGEIEELKTKKKGKFSIFDYIENSINSKKDFITPVIIPKHIEKARDVQTNNSTDLNPKLPLDTILIPNNAVQRETRKTGPKSELEMKIEEYKHIHPSEKKDLFKSVFDSSSESDLESNACDNFEIEVGAKISNELMDKLIKPSSLSQNILKNNSPPRGIFASLLSGTIKVDAISIHNNEKDKKIVFQAPNERKYTSEFESEDMYGPKLPQNVSAVDKTPKDKDYDNKILELLSPWPSEIKYVEKWVEKKHSSKHKKKTKKNSEKKSKHKKKRKSHKNY